MHGGGPRHLARVGCAIAFPFRQQPAAEGTVVADQHRGLGQQQFGAGIQVGFDGHVVPPGQVGHVGDHRHFGVVGGDGGDRAQVLRAAHEADLECEHRHVFQGTTRLIGHGFFVESDVVVDLGGVAHIGASYHGHDMDRCTGHGGQVRAQAARAAGVVGVENHHAGQRRFARRGGFGQGLGGVGHGGGQGVLGGLRKGRQAAAPIKEAGGQGPTAASCGSIQ
ncbi:hypothetical protein Y695_01010 [Hydrogenophaga sp. T4]|nr:hypothetical protein Y695_01010 [Hydrogenophaga sp. T4]